jgi:uroporphyrinogen decarboxylase
MTSEMTSKERMLAAMRNQKPDRVPVAPDISSYLPCRLTGKPYWDIWYRNDPPIWKAYIDAAKFFAIDGWFIYGGDGVQVHRKETPCRTHKEVRQDDEKIQTRITYETPAGNLFTEHVYPRHECPQQPSRLIKNLKEDAAKMRCLFPSPITGYDASLLGEMKKQMGDAGAVGVTVVTTGLHTLMDAFQREIEAVTFAYCDHDEFFQEYLAASIADCLKLTEIYLDARPDFILLGGSGMWLLSTPSIFREITLPVLQRQTRMAKEANIPSFLHSCGKERGLVEICAEETDLNCINPVEPPPTGDCDLADLKRRFGKKLSFMGNINTVDLMKNGSPDDVEKACLEALEAAAGDGGFILSTADECVDETPYANIHRMVEVARSWRMY